MLSLNHLGLADRAQDGAEALRETLVLFADLSDAAADAKIRGVRSVTTRPAVRRLRQASGAAAARGLEITVVLEGRAFEGSGAFLLGAILDRFFAEYIAINHFTQTIIRTVERGEMMRWPPASGLERRSLMFRSELAAEPWRFDLLAVLRRLERENPAKPRIGEARRLEDEFVEISQNPYLEFPDFEPRSCRARTERAHAPHGPLLGHVRPARRPAPDHDGRSV